MTLNVENFTTWVAILVVIGIVGNLSIGYILLWRKSFEWYISILVKNIIICDLIHLLLYGMYEILKLHNIKFLNSNCLLIYPVFSVTVCNPNLTTILICAFYTYKSSQNIKDTYPQLTIKGLLIVGWIACFFLFTPQVFVEDLTQVGEICEFKAIDPIKEIRIAYWFGLMCLQVIVWGLVVLFLCLTIRRLRIIKSTLSALSYTTMDLKESNPFSSQHPPSQRPSILHKTSQTNTIAKSNDCELVCVTTRFVTFSDTSESIKDSMTARKDSIKDFLSNQNGKMLLLLVLLFTHAFSLIPQNYFFLRYYFESVSNHHAILNMYKISSCLTLLNSVLNPIIFISLQCVLQQKNKLPSQFTLH